LAKPLFSRRGNPSDLGQSLGKQELGLLAVGEQCTVQANQFLDQT
jgi:hypothetical protein